MEPISRRDFVKTTAISAGGILVAGQTVFSKTSSTPQIYVPRMFDLFVKSFGYKERELKRLITVTL
ncbi:MAG: twin-arginine translocation signal domain-containing protein [Fibrobacter sp.]|nr:twin-arginine translocation signal domain-containing protein [Fibrobacter sp.]